MNHINPSSLRNVLAMLFAICAVTLIGCSGEEVASNDDSTNGGNKEVTTVALSVPPTLFLAAAPAEARPLIEVKEGAAVGDDVVFEARIGGKVEPFTESAATFLVADPAILTCTERHGDGCPTPWDYCCEPKDNLLRNLATVQIVDADGRPLRGSIKGVSGLDPMARVIVVGTVEQADGPVFVVNAEGLYVKEG